MAAVLAKSAKQAKERQNIREETSALRSCNKGYGLVTAGRLTLFKERLLPLLPEAIAGGFMEVGKR